MRKTLLILLFPLFGLCQAQVSDHFSGQYIVIESFPEELLPEGAVSIGFILEHSPLQDGFGIQTKKGEIQRLGNTNFPWMVDQLDHYSAEYDENNEVTFWYRYTQPDQSKIQVNVRYEWKEDRFQLMYYAAMDV